MAPARARPFARALPVVAVLWACAPDAPVEPPDPALRVISLSPALTRIALELGAREEIVGVDRYSQQLPGLEAVPSLGALFTPDLERTIELDPNLVLAIESANQASFLATLRARGVRVETFSGHSLEDVIESYGRVGRVLGRAPAGVALAERVRAELAALRAETASLERPSVAVIVESEPLYVVGGGSFVDALIEAAGGRNAFGDLSAPYPRVSLEALAARAPDVLVDTTSVAEGSADPPARSRWERFQWVGRVELIPQGVVTLPGPELAEAARLLRRRIHPEVEPARSGA